MKWQWNNSDNISWHSRSRQKNMSFIYFYIFFILFISDLNLCSDFCMRNLYNLLDRIQSCNQWVTGERRRGCQLPKQWSPDIPHMRALQWSAAGVTSVSVRDTISRHRRERSHTRLERRSREVKTMIWSEHGNAASTGPQSGLRYVVSCIFGSAILQT